MSFEADALRKLEDAKAIQDELLPDPEDAYGKIGAELRDSFLSFDRAAHDRAQEQADEAARTYARLRALWIQAKEAREADHLERLPETAAAIRFVSRMDFERREQKS